MANYNVLRFRKLKSFRAVTGALEHNERKRGNTLTDLCEANVVGIKSTGMIYSGRNYKEVVEERLCGKKIRKNATYGIEAVISFSPGAIKEDKLKEWIQLVFLFLKEQFGEKNIFSLNLHLSESTPHIHAIILPFDSQERMNCKVLDGKEKLENLQTELARKTEVLGLERGVSKEYTKENHEDFKKFKKDQAEKETRLETYEKFIFGNEEIYDDFILYIDEKNKERSEKFER